MSILRTVIEYIREHHPDAGELIKDCDSFSKKSTGKRLQGYSRVLYTGDNWNISIGHAVTPVITYQIEADYNNGAIIWTGQIKNGQVEEKSYEKILSK